MSSSNRACGFQLQSSVEGEVGRRMYIVRRRSCFQILATDENAAFRAELGYLVSTKFYFARNDIP